VHALALAELKLKKHVYLATAGMIAIVIDIPRLSTYLLEGVRIRSGLLWGLPLFLIASFLGAKVAQRYVDAVPDKLFRKIVLGFLAVVGMFLLIFGQAL
jgi:uncharacterized membrane protein YfcA